jgi:uncharacterized integral membrane protein
MQRQFLLLLLVSILISIFALTNVDIMQVRLFFWTYELSASLVILFSVALGASLIFLLGLSQQIALRLKLKDSEKKLTQANAELNRVSEINETLAQQIEVLKAEVNQLSLQTPSEIAKKQG